MPQPSNDEAALKGELLDESCAPFAARDALLERSQVGLEDGLVAAQVAERGLDALEAVSHLVTEAICPRDHVGANGHDLLVETEEALLHDRGKGLERKWFPRHVF